MLAETSPLVAPNRPSQRTWSVVGAQYIEPGTRRWLQAVLLLTDFMDIQVATSIF